MSQRLGDFNAKVIDQFLTSSVNMTKTTTIFKPLSLKSFCAAVAMSNNFHAITSNNFNIFSLTVRFVNISADLFSIVKVVIFHLQVRLYEFHQFTGYRIFRKVEKIWQESATTHHLQRLCPGWLHTHPLVILQKKEAQAYQNFVSFAAILQIDNQSGFSQLDFCTFFSNN